MSELSIVTPCFNEEANVELLYERVKKVVSGLGVSYEHVFIDNASKDNTVSIVKKLAQSDKNVKLIVNNRNFGPIRSPYHGLMQASGKAVVLMSADMQDPPELIINFIEGWRKGYKVVAAIKNQSEENFVMYWIRGIYYSLLKRIADVQHLKHFTGFGLYDRQVIETLRSYDDVAPYFRGLIAEMGYEILEIPFKQPKRHAGKTSTNFFRLYDYAMLGFVNHSKVPLRVAIFTGLFTAILSFLIAAFYFIYKIVYWRDFQVGMAPLVIGLFFFSSVQMFFLGILGEYIGAIYTQSKKRPLVVERERINF